MSQPISRRLFFLSGAAAATFCAFRRSYSPLPVEAGSSPSAPHDIVIVEFSPDGKDEGPKSVPTIVKSDAEWRHQLDRSSFDITRQAGTEYPYTGKYWNLHDKGLYRCICCATALFSSDTKFDSHTGWPSFWQVIAKQNVREISDTSLGMERTAVSCARCDAHLGHVFDDGPRPTGLRYCMNSVALTFEKLA